MRANPGGQIPPSEVVGRDELIARLWQRIEGQSLLLSAERRMGKTCVVKKMVSEALAKGPVKMRSICGDEADVRIAAIKSGE